MSSYSLMLTPLCIHNVVGGQVTFPTHVHYLSSKQRFVGILCCLELLIGHEVSYLDPDEMFVIKRTMESILHMLALIYLFSKL